MGTGDNAGGRRAAGRGADIPGNPRRPGRPKGRKNAATISREQLERVAAEQLEQLGAGGDIAGRAAGGRRLDGAGAAGPGATTQARIERLASIEIYVGAAGSGKSTAVKARLSAAPASARIIIDPDGEYGRFGTVAPNLAAAVDALAKNGPDPTVIFRPSFDRAIGIRQFSFLCALAWRYAERGRPLLFVVDELSEFTTASEAPAEWRRIVKRGRKAGLSIIAAAQRPAEIDKTIWSNASLVRSGRLNYADDQAVIAAALGVPRDQVAQLGQLDYLEQDRNSGELRHGRLTF